MNREAHTCSGVSAVVWVVTTMSLVLTGAGESSKGARFTDAEHGGSPLRVTAVWTT